MDVVVAMGMPTSNILKCTALLGSKEGGAELHRGALFYYGWKGGGGRVKSAEWSFNQMPSTSKVGGGFVGASNKMCISNNFKLFLHQRASKKSRYIR